MAFTLNVCEGENNMRSHPDPSADAIDRAIDGLIPAMYHFVILEAKPAIGECAYVQTLIEREGRVKGRYLIEARYKLAAGVRHYGKHVGDSDDVKRIFQAFAEGVAPNVAGWEDITGRL